ncbi:phospho-N-acetylmuramoyl-pentapeptide-transferase [soil metagenome]
MTLVLSALVSLLLVGVFVQLAGRFNLGKSVRRDGPSSHLVKEGTPTMGGVAFLTATVAVWLLTDLKTTDGLSLVLLTLAAALLGLYDDLLALRRKRQAAAGEDASTGLLARYRLAGQALVALLFSIYAVQAGHALFGPDLLDVLGFTFVIMGSINAVNFSDGLDGLAAGMVAIMLLPFLGVPFVSALVGSLLGFLWYNSKPARTFMGGVGSEALGAALAGTAILAGWVWYLPLLALVPVLEVLSVMIQVVYFRATGGKRFFKMSPLHHHFELSGWSEGQVVMRFWLVTAACVALAWGLRGGTV